jgi:hypothetical protein
MDDRFIDGFLQDTKYKILRDQILRKYISANKNREEGTMEEGRIKERMAGSQAM